MAPFIHDRFLLTSEQAVALYQQTAQACPIIDYHSHLNPREIAENVHYANITQAWLAGDHYKWRAMRTVGVNERFITGDASDREKFDAWAATVPKLLENPLYHWTHLELTRIFGETQLLSPATADGIWERTQAYLQTHGARDILKQMNVHVICTTDDPGDDLQWHRQVNAEEPTFRMFPTWRPEKAMKLKRRYDAQNFADFLATLKTRHAYFAEVGCRISDYSVESWAKPLSYAESEQVFNQENPSPEALAGFEAFMLLFFARLDAARDWARQLHIGALRNPNGAMFAVLGSDTGFDAMNDFAYARPLAEHLSALAQTKELPRTIVYNLNPKDNAMLAVLCGSFQDGTPGGRVNHGAAWWFLDQAEGIRDQLRALGQLGCMSQFVGMLTDSRSVLSMPRHEYFRRILCEMLGQDMARGVLPDDLEMITPMVKAMCYTNAVKFFHLS